MRHPRDRRPETREAIVLAVQTAVADIEREDRCSPEAQVAAFMSAAWPTLKAQNG